MRWRRRRSSSAKTAATKTAAGMPATETATAGMSTSSAMLGEGSLRRKRRGSSQHKREESRAHTPPIE
jgi:hypothetical protein